jgi:hypothetical protein
MALSRYECEGGCFAGADEFLIGCCRLFVRLSSRYLLRDMYFALACFEPIVVVVSTPDRYKQQQRWHCDYSHTLLP